MFKMTIGGYNKEYDLTKPEESSLMFGHIFLYYINKFPLFINILMTIADIENVEDDKKEQMAYTYFDHEFGRIKIFINFEKIEKLKMSPRMIMFLIFHEYLHNYYYHFDRMKEQFNENPTLANIIVDYYVNELLYELLGSDVNKEFENVDMNMINQKFMEEIYKSYGHKFPYNFNTKPLEPVLYEEMKKILPNIGNENSNNSKNKNDNDDNNDNNSNNDINNNNSYQNYKLDDHEVSIKKGEDSVEKVNNARKKEGKPNMSKSDLDTLAKNKIENIQKEMEQSIGIGSSEKIALREKEKLIKKNPFLNTLQLKRIISKKIQDSTFKSYKRISRKRDNSEIIFKGKTKLEGRKVVVALDVSGSISDKDLNNFYSMLNSFVSNKKTKTSLDIIYWSSCEIKPEVNFHENIKNIEELKKIKIHSSGGTDVEYLHDFIKDYYGKNKEKIVLINITDGYFYYNGKIPKECIQYYFILTEMNCEKDITSAYNDPRVKVKTIKQI